MKRLIGALVLASLAACSAPGSTPRAPRLPAAHLAAPTSASVATPTTETAPGARRALLIDLPTALQLAGARASEVRIARVRVDEARNRVAHTWFSLVPSVIPFFRAFDHIGQAQPQSGANVYVTRTNYETQVVVFTLWNPGPVALSALAARRRVDAAQAESEAARQDAVTRAAIGYLELVRARALLGVAADAVRESAELVRLEQSLERRGAATRALVLRARADLADRRQDLAAARGDAARAAALLAELLQLEPGTELVPRETAPLALSLVADDAGVERLVDRALAARPELARQEAEIAAREHERESVIYGPLVPFMANYLQTGVFGATLGKMRFSQDAFSLVGLHFGPGGIGDVPAIQIASRDVKAAHLDMQRVRASVQREVGEAKAALVEAESRLGAARAGVAASRELLRLSKDRLAKGVAIELEVLDAARVAERAEARLVAAIVDLDEAQFALLRAIGAPPH